MRIERTKRKLNNEGYSLVELIVSMLVMSMVMFIAIAFINSSRNTYERISTETSLQTEAQITTNYINEIMLEALEWGLVTSSDTDTVVYYADAPDNSEIGVSTKVLYRYYFILDKTTYKMYFTKLVKTDVSALETTAIANAKGNLRKLLAEHVKNVVFTTKSTNSTGELVNVDLTFGYASMPEKDYVTTLVVAGRNLKGIE